RLVVLPPFAGEHHSVVLRERLLLAPQVRRGRRFPRAEITATNAAIDVNATFARRGAVLLIAHTDASQEAAELVERSGDDRDASHVTFAAFARKTRGLRRELRRRARLDDRNGDRAAPLADLNDERHVFSRGHILETEVTRFIGERGRDRIAAHLAATITRCA